MHSTELFIIDIEYPQKRQWEARSYLYSVECIRKSRKRPHVLPHPSLWQATVNICLDCIPILFNIFSEKAVSEQIERDIKSKIFKIGSPEHIAAVNLLMEKYNYENSLKAFLKKELKRRNSLIQEDLKSGIEYVQRFYPAQNPDFSLYEPYVEDYTFLK